MITGLPLFGMIGLTILTHRDSDDIRAWSMDTGSIANSITFGAAWLSLLLDGLTLIAVFPSPDHRHRRPRTVRRNESD
jgi:hypothetical protein